jgi:hypothetical protein
MMIVYLRIALALNREIKPTVRSKQRQHVVKEAATRINITGPFTVKLYFKIYIRFFRGSLYFIVSHFIHLPLFP